MKKPASSRGLPVDMRRTRVSLRRLHRSGNLHLSRWRHRGRRLLRAAIASVGMLMATFLTAIVTGGLSDDGLLLMLFTTMMVFILFAIFPRWKPPAPADPAKADIGQLADSTAAWLDDRRLMLPDETQASIDRIDVRLAELGPQLASLQDETPAAGEVRKLLVEHLPALVENYIRIPESLKDASHAGSTPTGQLASGLDVIEAEIRTMTNSIARGDMDALATRGIYLETRYSISDRSMSDRAIPKRIADDS